MAQIKCKKCGANVEFDTGTKFAKCSYCSSQIYIDKSGAGFFYILPYFIDINSAGGIFKRWTAGSKMAKNLESEARVMQFKQQYFPIYMFKRDIGGREIVFIEPAKTTTLPGMHNLKVPAGDIKIFDQKYDYGGVELIKPDIDMVAYLPNLQGEAKEQALVYFPIYNILYDYRGRNYQAVIDGSSGEVFATDYPPRAAAPYHILTIVGFIAFFIITLLYFLSPLVPLVGLPIFFIAMFYLGYYIAKNR